MGHRLVPIFFNCGLGRSMKFVLGPKGTPLSDPLSIVVSADSAFLLQTDTQTLQTQIFPPYINKPPYLFDHVCI